MCFSAGASFGASAVLGMIGAGGVVKAKTVSQGLFATIPFAFSLQQLSEGMLWLSFKHPGLEAGQSFFIYTYLVFAMMIWPIWIPITIRLFEKDNKRKKIMNLLLGIGVIVSGGVGCILLLYRVQAIPAHHHIHFMVDFPPVIKNLIWLFNLLYIMATVVTPFVSSIKRMKWLGIVFLIAYLFAVIFYAGFVLSVWCYFAALLSAIVIWIISGIQREM